MVAIVELMILAVLQTAGCAGIGPHTVARDRFDYVSAISESWKRQTLLNVIKTRYADAPVFMDVLSVINQYAVEGQLDLGFSWTDPIFGDTQSLGGHGKYTDRPTITYSPLMGEKFTRSLMTPIPVSAIMFLVQAGYPADYVFRICVQTINGLQNRSGGTMMGRAADPRFHELLTLLRHIQVKGGMGMRVMFVGEKQTVVMFFRPLTDRVLAGEIGRVRQLLGLSPNAREIRLAYGSFAANDAEIAILSRSMLQIMIEYASYIDVPEAEVSEGRVGATRRESTQIEKLFPPLIRVRVDTQKPDDAYVKVRYRDRWFWIEDRDFHSKRIFYFLMLLFSLTERGGNQGAPIVTVPTN
jgi:hypothetical protein